MTFSMDKRIEVDLGQIKAFGAARCSASGKTSNAEVADSGPKTLCSLKVITP